MSIPRKKKSAVEIPLTSTADVAFLLLVFFLVAASNAVEKGVPLDLPNTSKTQEKKKSENLEVGITVDAITLGGEPLANENSLQEVLRAKLAGVTEPSLRVVVVTAAAAVDYQRWTRFIAEVEMAGGIPAPQIEEEETRPASGSGPVDGGEAN